MLTDSFKFLRFLCVFLCIFSAYTATASEAEDCDDSCWEFGPEDYIDDDDDEDDEEEECRCLWSEEDLAKAAEYDKIVEQVEEAELEGNLYGEKQPRGLGKWFAKKLKKMFAKFLGFKKVKNLDQLAYQIVRFNRKVGKFVKVPSIDKMICELSKTDLTPEMLEKVSERLKYYKKHKHAKPQNNKNIREKEEFKMHPKIVDGSMQVLIGVGLTAVPYMNIAGSVLIASGIVNISEGVICYLHIYLDFLEQKPQQNGKPCAMFYRFDFKNYCATEGTVVAA